MSLSTAMYSALSGLTAAGRGSTVISENIANAMTPGYVRRTLELTTPGAGTPGVKVAGVTRHSNPALLSDRREADARMGHAGTLADFRTRAADAVGLITDPGSIAARLAEFESALISAASLPESAQRHETVVLNAKALATAINEAGDSLQSMRAEADRKIGVQVDRLNAALESVEELNSQIAGSSGSATSALMDHRQALLDEINEIVPINVVNRDYGKVALYTDGGSILLDGSAVPLEFDSRRDVVADMSLAGGTLSPLSIAGKEVPTGRTDSRVPGGTLDALFQIRDELGPAEQSELDSLARDLMERFEDPSIDPTVAPGAAGLFTDRGAAFDPSEELGLAGRLQLNAAVDPAQGGSSWRIRDGLGAATPGEPGDARQIQRLHGALEVQRTPATGTFGTGLMTATDMAATHLSRVAGEASVAERTRTFAATMQTEMKQIELSNGVDTDAELAQLMLVEQAFAANARMFSVIDELMETLVRM